MSPGKRLNETFSKLQLLTKLLLIFFLFLVLVAGAGGMGWFSIKKIQGISEIATPLFQTTSDVMDLVQKANVAVTVQMALKEERGIQEQEKIIKSFETSLQEKEDRLSRLIGEGKLELDLKALVNGQQQFFRLASNMAAVHQKIITQETTINKRIGEFEGQLREIDKTLRELIGQSQTAINASEDRIKTLIQAGNAAGNDLEKIIAAMFGQDFPFLVGGLQLQHYLIQVQEDAREYFSENDAKKLAGVAKDYQATLDKASSRLQRIKSRAKTPELKNTLEKVSESLTKVKDGALSAGGLFAARREYLALNDQLESMKKGLGASTRDFQAELDRFFHMVGEYTEKSQQGVIGQAKKNLSLIIFTGAIIVFGIALRMAFAITRAIKRAVAELSEISGQVVTATAQVSSGSRQLSEGSSEQAASLEETTASLEEMTSMTRQNADNAQQANVLMTESGRVVEQANQSMDRLMTAMQEISGASNATAKIIKTIDGIAFQTNLLALNAAVEAARAGEAGAGFAVVADEVRSLAMRSADAAKNTAELIENTLVKVKEGEDLVNQANRNFTQVTTSSSKAQELVAEITTASQEQAQGVDQISKAVAAMDKIVQENAANAEESASASVELASQAEQMKRIVKDLLTLVVGSRNNILTGAETRSVSPRVRAGSAVIRKIQDFKEQMAIKAVQASTGPALAVPAPLKTRVVKPEQIIPLEDDDFKSF